MGALEPGSSAYVAYDEDLYHERLILCWVQAGEYIVASPDFDVFIEQLDAASGDVSAIRYGDNSGILPAGLAGQRIYSFNPRPTGLPLSQLIGEGVRHARTERLARGLVGVAAGIVVEGAALAPVVVPAARAAIAVGADGLPLPPGPGARAGPAGLWVLDEPVGEHKVGAIIELPPGALDCGGRCFVRVEDRVVAASKLAPGTLVKSWADARVQAFLDEDGRCFGPAFAEDRRGIAACEIDMAGGPSTFPGLRGPATLCESLRGVISRGSAGFVAAHDRWVVEARIELNNRSRYEHRTIAKVLDLAAVADGLNIKRLVSLEYLNRRRQLIEEAHREDPSRPSFDSAHLYMGEDDEAAGVHMSTALRAHVASELSKETAILKERRKAGEAKETRAKAGPGKGGHGGGK